MDSFYCEDLAYIHDVGFSGLSRRAGAHILAALDEGGFGSGLIVDLGCGSGAWAAMACAAGYSVLGFDVSEPMLHLARSKVPAAEFHLSSLYDAGIPQCVAVTAFGEALNYAAPDRPTPSMLRDLFGRVFSSLIPGGLFVFDVLIHSEEPPMQYRTWSGGPDYAVLVDVRESVDKHLLRRDITMFRAIGGIYRRSEEHHVLAIYSASLLESLLSSAGFQVEISTQYGEYGLDIRRAAFIARKGAT